MNTRRITMNKDEFYSTIEKVVITEFRDELDLYRFEGRNLIDQVYAGKFLEHDGSNEEPINSLGIPIVFETIGYVLTVVALFETIQKYKARFDDDSQDTISDDPDENRAIFENDLRELLTEHFDKEQYSPEKVKHVVSNMMSNMNLEELSKKS